MKFSFKIQQYQTDAVDAVARVFQGQSYNAGVSYLRDMGSLSAQPQQLSLVSSGDDATQVELLDLINDSGFKNEALQLTDQELLQKQTSISRTSWWNRWAGVLWILRWKPAQARPMFTSRPCSS